MSSNQVQEIKDRLPIGDIIGSYIKLDKAGINFKGKCPFHNEKTPSFFVSPERGSYYCFGCGAKGDIFSFVQEFEKIDFKEALSLLAERAGVVLEKFSGSSIDTKEHDEKEVLKKIMEEAAIFFEENLKKDTKALEYLKSRGLEDKTIAEWRIGSTIPGWGNLYQHLKEKGFADADIEKAGLAKPGSRGLYDRFRTRVIFPIFDSSGHVIAFTGRLKEWEKEDPTEGKEEIKEAKYLNSPDTPLFDKSRTLYGFHKAKRAISKWRYFILVEGQMDLIMAHQAGFENAVATSGTALTQFQLEALIRFSKNLMIVYDGDNAGVEAARRAWVLALSLGMDVKIASMPKEKDPADVLKEDPALFKESLKKGLHLVEFYLNALLARISDKRTIGKSVEKEVLPYIKAIDSAIDRQHFISLVSAKTGIKEDALLSAMDKAVAAKGAGLTPDVSDDTISPHNNFSKRRLIAGLYILLNEEENARKYLENADSLKDELVFTAEEWIGRNGQKKEDLLKDILTSLQKEEIREKLEEAMRANNLKEADELRKKLAEF